MSKSSIGAPNERTDISIGDNGRVRVVIGTQPSGQGHETSFAQVVADLLVVPVETVDIVLGDTDIVQAGGGSHSGRSMRHAATVFVLATQELIERGKRIMAVLLPKPHRRLCISKRAAFACRAHNAVLTFWS